MRKSAALLSVLLILSVARCMASCIALDAAPVSHADSSAVPPCHHHKAPAQHSQDSLPCQSHPGGLAYSVSQPAAHVDPAVSLLPAVHSLATVSPLAAGASTPFSLQIPPLPLDKPLAPIVLRI
jgi:hypothetical protein